MDRSLTLVNRVSRLELCLPATDGRSENAETEKHGRRTAGKTTATRRIPVHTPAAAAADDDDDDDDDNHKRKRALAKRRRCFYVRPIVATYSG